MAFDGVPVGTGSTAAIYTHYNVLLPPAGRVEMIVFLPESNVVSAMVQNRTAMHTYYTNTLYVLAGN